MLRYPRDGSILPFFLFLMVIAAACFWFAATGVRYGQTRLPLKHNPSSQQLTQAEKPVLFWTSISIFAGLGTGCTVLTAWLVMQQRK